jgi:hypothetical protein
MEIPDNCVNSMIGLAIQEDISLVVVAGSFGSVHLFCSVVDDARTSFTRLGLGVKLNQTNCQTDYYD